MFKKITEIKNKFMCNEKSQNKEKVYFESVAICPKCGNHLIEIGNVFGCTGAIKKECSFVIPNILEGNKVSKSNVQDIINFSYAIALNNLMDKSKEDAIKAIEDMENSNQETQSKHSNNTEYSFKMPTKFRCPKCKYGLYEENNILNCTSKNCNFKLKKSYGGLYFKESEINTLLSGNEVKGLWIKNDNDTSSIKVNIKLKDFECVHDIINIKNNTVISRDNKLKESESDILGTVIGNCPICSGDVVSQDKAYICNNSSDNSCSFNIEKNFFDSKIYPSDAKKLLKGESTDKKKFTNAKNNKHFYARIQLVNNKAKLVFDK